MANTGLTLIPESLENIRRWNNDIPPGIETPVHNLIQTQREKTPQFGAVCAWDGQFTYAELDDLSTRLASSLILRGVKAETFVPVCFEKSRWTVVAVLAVLKAGGAFVLLDPSLPVARLRSIVDQTGATLALSSVKSASLCKSLVKEVQQVDECSLANIETGSIHPAVDSRDAAYIMFTSGSTGVPKGVMVEHSSLSSTSVYSGQAMGYGPGCRNFQFASHAFDPIITDIFATLVHGGTICIPSDWERENDTVGAMRRLQVSHLRLTPSLFGSLDIKNIPSLSTVVLGGEVTPAHLVEEWSKKVRLILVYGPAECCVICFGSDTTTHACQPGEIGRPFSARAWVVKQGSPNELAEVGEIGELVVEGPTVARGYLRNPEKTAEVFIPNPRWLQCFPEIPCQYRFYRTGDLVRQLEDGAFVYAGRADNQVKIRGQRLELEEVEQHLRRALSRISQIETKQVVVLAVDFPGMASKHLVALLCLGYSASIGAFRWERNASERLETSDQDRRNLLEAVSLVKAEMGESLPPFAIPSLWVPLRDVPLTVSKKVDRKLLQSAVSSSSIKELSLFTKTPSITNGHHAVRNSHEIKVRELWANVFGISADMIESDDHFISLGGDSVLAIKLAGTARSSGLSLSFDTILKNPVLRDMASKAEVLPEQPESFSVSPFSLLDSAEVDAMLKKASKECDVTETCIEDIYPCSPMQEGLIAASTREQGTYILQQVYELPQSIDLNRLREAWDTVANRTPVMRSRFLDHDTKLLQVVVKETTRWLAIEGELRSLLATEKKVSVSPRQTISSVVVCVDAVRKNQHLIWTVHHALLDGWAESDIAIAVEEEYFRLSPTTPNPPGFNLFIKHIESQDVQEARDFWRQQLDGAKTPVFPPYPTPSYVPKVERSNRIVNHLASQDDGEMIRRAPKLKGGIATPATMIQASWLLLLAFHSGVNDVVTGVTLNGRGAALPGIEHIVGPTITTIPLRAIFDPAQSMLRFLGDIQSRYLDILPHSQFGLQNIRRLGDDAVAACKFRTLIIVQSAQRSSEERKILIGRGYAFPVMDFAIVLESEILEDSIDFRATFDGHVVTEAQVRRILSQMEALVYEISQSKSSTSIADVLKASKLEKPQFKDSACVNSCELSIANGNRGSHRKSSGEFEPPRTEREMRLARIWESLLDTERVGRSDNFFERGGGSVLAMRLVSLARRQGLTLTVSSIFEAQTLQEMALKATVQTTFSELRPFSLISGISYPDLRSQAARQCDISDDDIEDMYPCHRFQLHYILGYPEAQRDPSTEPWHWQSQSVYRLPSSMDLARFQNAWRAVIQRHQSQRTRVTQSAEGIFQVVLKNPGFSYWTESEDLESYLEQDRSDYMTFGSPLLRLALVQPRESDERLFVLTAQHIIYDAFSRMMLFKDVETVYKTGRLPEHEPPKMNSFVKYMLEADKSAATEFWTSLLTGARTKPILTSPGKSALANIREEVATTKLPQLRASDTTLATMLEVAAGLALARHIDCSDVILYCDRSGRNLPVQGIEDLIACTTMFIPMRIHVDAQQKVRDLLTEAQRLKSLAIPHEHLGWLELREMDHLKPVLANSVNVNINPYPNALVGRGLGLEFLTSHLPCDDPFGININILDEQLIWSVYYDEEFISNDNVNAILEGLQKILYYIVEADHDDPAVLVGDVLTTTS